MGKHAPTYVRMCTHARARTRSVHAHTPASPHMRTCTHTRTRTHTRMRTCAHPVPIKEVLLGHSRFVISCNLFRWSLRSTSGFSLL